MYSSFPESGSLTQLFLAKIRKLAALFAPFGQFGCVAAPLECKKHARHVFILSPRRFFHTLSQCLAILFLITTLSLTHCSSDNGGGGNGGGTDDPDDPAGPDRPTTLGAIYFWTSTCGVKGNMEGCGNTDTGRDAADKICRERYSVAASLDDDDRVRIAAEAEAAGLELKHTALLATDDLHPQDLDIRAKDDLKIRFADGNTLRARSWNDYFTLNFTIETATHTARGIVWSGVGTDFEIGNHCDDWTSDSSTGDVGASDGDGDNGRLHEATGQDCNTNFQLLCITH